MNRIDLNWDDNEVLPDRIRPDVEFLFYRMSRATIDMVNPGPAERVLDIGCGRAIDIVNMSQSGATLIGIEPSFVMISHARETLKLNGKNTHVLQAIGESIPIAAGSVDKVVCKGALDHFAEPGEVLQQMAVVLRPGGYAVIAIANFGSLGFMLGKLIFWVRRIFNIKNPYKRLPWEPPPDHTVKFNYGMLLKLAGRHMKVEKITGVSLLCCVPGWGDLLSNLPRGLCRLVMVTLDGIARLIPYLSDVIVLKCVHRIQD